MTSSFDAFNASAIERYMTYSDEERQDILRELRDKGYSDESLQLLFGLPAHKGDAYEEFVEDRINKLVLLYVPPFLLIFGTLGNLFSFLILRHRSMNKQSIYVYLSTLAIFDSFVLYFGLIRIWVNEIRDSDIRDESAWLCKGLLTLGYTCSDVSVWLIVAVTLERYFVVSHPLKAHHFCQDVRARKIIAGIVVLFFLINAHFLFSTDLLLIVDEFRPTDPGKFQCKPSPGFEILIYFVWPWVDALLYGFGPFVIISVLNSVIVVKCYPVVIGEVYKNIMKVMKRAQSSN